MLDYLYSLTDSFFKEMYAQLFIGIGYVYDLMDDYKTENNIPVSLGQDRISSSFYNYITQEVIITYVLGNKQYEIKFDRHEKYSEDFLFEILGQYPHYDRKLSTVIINDEDQDHSYYFNKLYGPEGDWHQNVYGGPRTVKQLLPERYRYNFKNITIIDEDGSFFETDNINEVVCKENFL